MRNTNAMAILEYFLRLLEFMGQVGEFLELLSSPIGLTAMVCLTSYECLLLFGCDATNSAVLSLVITLTYYTTSNRPNF